MGRDVQTPALIIDADSPQGGDHGLLLDVGRYRRLLDPAVPMGLLDQRGEALRERSEQHAQVLCAQTEVVVVQQGLIGALPLRREAFAVGACQLHVALEVRSEGGEIVRFASHAPALLPLGGSERDLRCQIGGYASGTLPVATGDAHHVAIDFAQIVSVELLQPLAELLGGRPLVGQPGQRAELMPPPCRARGGHHHQLIPGGEHLQGRQVGQLGHATSELLQRCHRCEDYEKRQMTRS